MALGTGFDVVNVAMDGTDKSVVFPDTLATVTMYINGADVTMKPFGASATITLKNGIYFSIQNRILRNKTFIFNGASGTVELFYENADS